SRVGVYRFDRPDRDDRGPVEQHGTGVERATRALHHRKDDAVANEGGGHADTVSTCRSTVNSASFACRASASAVRNVSGATPVVSSAPLFPASFTLNRRSIPSWRPLPLLKRPSSRP